MSGNEEEMIGGMPDAQLCAVRPTQMNIYKRGPKGNAHTVVSVLPCGVKYIEGSFEVHCDGSRCPVKKSEYANDHKNTDLLIAPTAEMPEVTSDRPYLFDMDAFKK